MSNGLAFSYGRNKIVTKSTALRFGQYTGMTVEEVMEIDASYLLWADDEGIIVIDDVELMDEIQEVEREQDGEKWQDSWYDGLEPWYDGFDL